MSLTLRPITASELEPLRDLWRQAGLPFEPEGRDSLEELEWQRSRDPDLWIGAYADGALIGSVMGTDDGRKGWINRLAVQPKHRREAVARQLAKGCEDALRARGRIIITALVEHENAASIAFFEAAGYALRKDVLYLRKAWGPASGSAC